MSLSTPVYQMTFTGNLNLPARSRIIYTDGYSRRPALLDTHQFSPNKIDHVLRQSAVLYDVTGLGALAQAQAVVSMRWWMMGKLRTMHELLGSQIAGRV